MTVSSFERHCSTTVRTILQILSSRPQVAVFPANLKKAGISELVDIADDLSTIFSGTSSTMDKISAGADLLLGTDFNSKSSIAVRKGASDSKVRESIETG